jgi:hypothetical protein
MIHNKICEAGIRSASHTPWTGILNAPPPSSKNQGNNCVQHRTPSMLQPEPCPSSPTPLNSAAVTFAQRLRKPTVIRTQYRSHKGLQALPYQRNLECGYVYACLCVCALSSLYHCQCLVTRCLCVSLDLSVSCLSVYLDTSVFIRVFLIASLFPYLIVRVCICLPICVSACLSVLMSYALATFSWLFKHLSRFHTTVHLHAFVTRNSRSFRNYQQRNCRLLPGDPTQSPSRKQDENQNLI